MLDAEPRPQSPAAATRHPRDRPDRLTPRESTQRPGAQPMRSPPMRGCAPTPHATLGRDSRPLQTRFTGRSTRARPLPTAHSLTVLESGRSIPFGISTDPRKSPRRVEETPENEAVNKGTGSRPDHRKRTRRRHHPNRMIGPTIARLLAAPVRDCRSSASSEEGSAAVVRGPEIRQTHDQRRRPRLGATLPRSCPHDEGTLLTRGLAGVSERQRRSRRPGDRKRGIRSVTPAAIGVRP